MEKDRGKGRDKVEIEVPTEGACFCFLNFVNLPPSTQDFINETILSLIQQYTGNNQYQLLNEKPQVTWYYPNFILESKSRYIRSNFCYPRENEVNVAHDIKKQFSIQENSEEKNSTDTIELCQNNPLIKEEKFNSSLQLTSDHGDTNDKNKIEMENVEMKGENMGGNVDDVGDDDNDDGYDSNYSTENEGEKDENEGDEEDNYGDDKGNNDHLKDNSSFLYSENIDLNEVNMDIEEIYDENNNNNNNNSNNEVDSLTSPFETSTSSSDNNFGDRKKVRRSLDEIEENLRKTKNFPIFVASQENLISNKSSKEKEEKIRRCFNCSMADHVYPHCPRTFNQNLFSENQKLFYINQKLNENNNNIQININNDSIDKENNNIDNNDTEKEKNFDIISNCNFISFNNTDDTENKENKNKENSPQKYKFYFNINYSKLTKTDQY